MLPVPVRDWGEAITTSFAQAFSLLLAAIPRIIGFLIIIAIGWFIATLIARAAAALLRRVHSTTWPSAPASPGSSPTPGWRPTPQASSPTSPSGSSA